MCEHRRMDRAAERRENRRRKRVKRVVGLIALSFILPMVIMFAPISTPAQATVSDPIYAEAMYGWYNSASYNHWYMHATDGEGWYRFDIEAEIGADQYITDITLYIYTDGAGTGDVEITEVNAFTGAGGASELDGATARTANPQGDVILTFSQGGGASYKSSSDAALTTWANGTYQSDGHLYLGMDNGLAITPSEAYNYPWNWGTNQGIAYVVVTYEAETPPGWAPTITSAADTTALVDEHYSYTITTNESSTFSAILGDSAISSEDFAPAADRGFTDASTNAWATGSATVYYASKSGTDYGYSYLRFNMSDDGLDADVNIQNAYLLMYCQTPSAPASVYSFYTVSVDWLEDNTPAEQLVIYPSGLISQGLLSTHTGGDYDAVGWHNMTSSALDARVTSQFEATGCAYLGLGATAADGAFTYRSKEYAGTDYDPYLRVLSSFPSWLTFTPANATLWGTPTIDELGDWDVDIKATSDAGGFDAYQNFTVTVVEAAPEITNSPGTDAIEDAYYSWGATCSAADSGANDWTFDTDADFLSLTGETELNVTVGGTPDDTDVGEWYVNVTVEDGDSSDFENYTLTVTAWERWGPTFTSSPVETGVSDSLYEYVATCNETVTWPIDDDITTNATWLYWGQANHTVWGTPGPGVASYYVNLTATSVAGELEGYQNYTVTISDWRWAPTFISSGPTDVLNNTAYAYEVTVNESATLDLEGNATFLSFDAQGWLNGTPTVTGWYYVNISAESTAGTLTAWQNFTLTVSECTEYILRPNSDELIEWDQNPATGEHWEKVDETADGGDGAVTYVASTAPGESDRWGLTDLPAESPCDGYDLEFWVIGRKTAAGDANITYGVYIGTTYYELGYMVPTTSYANYSVWQNISPATGLEWTFAEINSMQFVVYGEDPSPVVRITQAAVIVTFHDAISPIASFCHGYKSEFGPAIDIDLNFTYSETGLGIWFSPACAWDNLAITNWTWEITINEVLDDTLYFGGWAYRYVTVGDYAVNLTVRDAYGNEDSHEHLFTLNRTAILRPDGDGAGQYLTGDYEDIQDGVWYITGDPHDENGSYLYTPDTTDFQYSNFTMDDFTGNHALETFNVTLFIWALELGADSTIAGALQYNLNTYWGIYDEDITETYVNYTHTWYVCPWTGVEWTTDDINATVIKLGFHDGDPGGRITKAGLIITIYPPDLEDPVADAGADRTVDRGSVTFDGSGSTDNIAITNYTWTFTYDGSTQTLYGVAPSFEFVILGTYVITLNVTDDYANYDTDTVTFIVVRPSFQWVEWSADNIMGFIGLISLLICIALPPIVVVYARSGSGDRDDYFKFIMAWIVAAILFVSSLVW